MGKGAGCVPSTFKGRRRVTVGSPDNAPKADTAPAAPPPAADGEQTAKSEDQAFETPASAVEEPASVLSEKIKIFIVYYSMYGHVLSLARKVKEGVDSVEGVEGVLYQVPETLSQDVLTKMSGAPKDESIPVISAAELPAADGLIFGFPTRYGAMAAQMKAFFDTTGKLWQEQGLAGKPAGIFVSTGTQGGGQETTAWTAITQLAHHGMLYVPIGYTFGSEMFKLDEIRGGSPYGAGTFAGDGTRQPTDTELALAEHQGRYTAGIVKHLHRS